MNENRRRTNLEKKLQFLEKEIDRQEKAKTGLEQLAKVYKEQPDFVDEKGADDVTRELEEVRSTQFLIKALGEWYQIRHQSISVDVINHIKGINTHLDIQQ